MKFLMNIKTLIASLLFIAAIAATGTEFPWLSFDNHDFFETESPVKDSKSWPTSNGTLRVSTNGLRVSGNSSPVILTQRKFQVYSYDSPRAAIFDYTLHSATPVKLQLNVTYGKKKPLSVKAVTLNPGHNQVRVDIPNAKQVKFSSLELTGNGKIDVTFHKAKLDFDSDPAHSFTVKLERPAPINIIRPGESVALQLVNHAPKPLPYILMGKISSFSGHTIAFSHQGIAKGGESITVPLIQKLPLLGYWTVSWTISSGKTQADGKTGLAVLPELPEYKYKKGDFMFGICSHPSRWPIADRELEALLAKRLGASFVRTTVTWNVIQPLQDPNYFDYSLFDSVVNIFGKQGIEIQGMLVFSARHAAPANLRDNGTPREWSRAKPNLDAWRKYAETTVSRYRGKIHIWEIWNEPDLYGFAHFNVADYIDIARVSNEAIRKAAPENTIFSAGFAGLANHPNRKDPDYQYKAMRDGKQYFDVHAYHGHAGFTPFSQQVDRKLLPLRKKAGATLPWYANETAVCAINNSERTQAITLFKKLLFCWSRGAIGYNWYDLRNDGINLNNPENTYGLVSFEFEAKPAAAVYHTLVHYFRGASYLKQVNLPPGCHGYLFRNGKDILLATWNESKDFAGPVPVNAVDSSGVEKIDCMGNKEQVASNGGNFLLTPTSIPAIYRISNARNLEILEPLFNIACTPAVAGKTFQLTLTAANPYQHQIELQFSFPSTNGISFQPETQKITLKPGLSQTLSFEGNASAKAQTNSIQLDYKVSMPSHSARVTVPLRAATVIPQQVSKNRRKPDFRLNRTEQLVSIGEGDPAMKDYTWTGVDDASALIWLQAEKDYLEIYAVTHDDIFIQQEPVDTLWKGDSIQLALVIPGQKGGWKIDLARNKRGGKLIRKAPVGFESTTSKAIILTTNRDDKRKLTVYRAKLPFKAFGLSEEILKKGIRFNLLLIDNDGPIRESYMQLYPGLEEWKNINFFPLIVFE